MRYIILVLLMLNFVSAVDVDFDCPDEIFIDEEFECSLEIVDGDGEYDVKIDLDGERNSVLEVYNGREWKSGYFYLLEFDGGEVELKVSEEGDYEGVLKLRQGDKREFFDIEILVVERQGAGENGGQTTEDGGLSKEIVLSSEPQKVISLNGDFKQETVYESEDSKIMSYVPYGFSLFLIFIIVILIWERR